MKPTRALSIRQPFVEEILRGSKKVEFRSRPTKIFERVYIYASLKPREEAEFERAGLDRDALPRGLIVGTVEVYKCTYGDGWYRWHLRKPERLARRLKPRNRPQPVWFRPF